MSGLQPDLFLSGGVTLFKSFNLSVPLYSYFWNGFNNDVRIPEGPADVRTVLYFLAVLYLSFETLSSVTFSAKPSWTTGRLGDPLSTSLRTHIILHVTSSLFGYIPSLACL